MSWMNKIEIGLTEIYFKGFEWNGWRRNVWNGGILF